jgi:hypothetical protein
MNCAINRPPAIKGKFGGIEKYLADSLTYPEMIKLEDVSFIEVLFTVNKQGNMYEPTILKSQQKSLSEEVVRVLKSVQGWYPAVSHNRTIDHTYTISIAFYPDKMGVQIQEIPNPYQRLN